jgi:hypothetical protein
MERALRALSLMRRLGLSLPDAARTAGTTPASVIRQVGAHALYRGRRGWVAKPHDLIPRPMNFLTVGGPMWVLVQDSRTATLIGRHANALQAYLYRGDDRPLRRLRDRFLIMGGRRLSFLTDLDAIDRLAEGGELHYELYRR